MTVVYPKLNQFLDYRTFLVAHAQEQRRRNPQWSYGAWAKRLGLGGTATITRIIHGDRHPGPKLVEKLIVYFGFNPREVEYFRDLVQLDKIKANPQMTSALLEQLDKKYSSDAKASTDEKTFQIISNWYYLAIREMVRLDGFQADPVWIAEKLRFKVPVRQISHAIQILRDLGLIKTDQNGHVKQIEVQLETSSKAAREATLRYQEEMLENAKQSLRNCSYEEQEMTSQTFAFKTHKLGQAKALMKEFQERMAELVEEEKGDHLYQFQLQFFPLTQKSTLSEHVEENLLDIKRNNNSENTSKPKMI